MVSKKCGLPWSCRMMDVYLVLQIMSLPTRGPSWPWIVRLQHIFPPFCYNSVSVFFFYHFLIPSLTFIWQPQREILSEGKLFCVSVWLTTLKTVCLFTWQATRVLHTNNMALDFHIACGAYTKSNFVCKWYANPSCYLLWRADQQTTTDKGHTVYSISPFSKHDCWSVPVTAVPELCCALAVWLGLSTKLLG